MKRQSNRALLAHALRPLALVTLVAVTGVAGAAAVPVGEYGSGGSKFENPTRSGHVPVEDFDQLDKNRDGVITQEEAAESKVLRGNFADADANQDGAIDRSEFAAYETLEGSEPGPPAMSPEGAQGTDASPPTGNPPAKDPAGSTGSVTQRGDDNAADLLFDTLDVNHDGRISKSEAQQMRSLKQNFQSADADHDRNVSRAEFSAFEQAPPPGISRNGTEHPTQSGDFSRLDTNGDGLINKDEATRYPALEQHFGQADADMDGTISQSEFAAFQLDQAVNPRPTVPPGAGQSGTMP